MTNRDNTFNIDIRVYIEDTDAGGIVYYVNYLKFMERGRSELLRQLGYNKAALAFDNQQFVVTKANVDYHLPCYLDDFIQVQTSILELRPVSIVFQQHLYRNQKLSCSGTIKVANVSFETKKPMKLPESMYNQLSGYVI